MDPGTNLNAEKEKSQSGETTFPAIGCTVCMCVLYTAMHANLLTGGREDEGFASTEAPPCRGYLGAPA
jgi:hypothetical protein